MMLNFLYFLLVLGFFTYLDFKYACKCGRDGGWYYDPVWHEKTWVMVLRTVVCSVFAISSIVAADLWGIVIVLPLSMFLALRVWKHESGKIKKWAAKALGRVQINKHGRLEVEVRG